MPELLKRHQEDRGDFIANIKQLSVVHRCLLEPIHSINRNLALALFEVPADSPYKLQGYWPAGNVSHETVNEDAEVAFRVDLAEAYCKHVQGHARMLAQLALLAAPRAEYPK